jgi:hypothetical protein
MNTIKKIIIATFFIIIPHLIAQDSTKSFSFPHKTGDMWEYFYSDGLMNVDTLQNFTIFDSTDSNGLILIKQHARFINPILPAALFTDTTLYWIDTTNNFVYGYGFDFKSDSSLIYKLNGMLGEQWVMFDTYAPPGSYRYGMARIRKNWDGSLFGRKTTFKEVYYYLAKDIADTTGYSTYGSDLLADGFGLIQRGGGEFPGYINIMGVIINGTLYGDTTLVLIKDKKNQMPITIKLFQNYPNPFNPSTTICFELPSRLNISLIVYDILGKEIKRLIDSRDYSTGLHKIIWDGEDNNRGKTGSGIYFYRLLTDKLTISHSMVLLK